jgi:hypothetical protein
MSDIPDLESLLSREFPVTIRIMSNGKRGRTIYSSAWHTVVEVIDTDNPDNSAEVSYHREANGLTRTVARVPKFDDDAESWEWESHVIKPKTPDGMMLKMLLQEIRMYIDEIGIQEGGQYARITKVTAAGNDNTTTTTTDQPETFDDGGIQSFADIKKANK